MKRKIISAVLIMLTLFYQNIIISVDAAEVNSIPVNMGDTIIYEIRVNPCPNVIQALDVVIHYDSTSLEYVPYSIELPNITGFMTNTNIDGEIRFNAMDFEGFDFSEDKILSTVRFKVKDVSAENLNLSNEIKAFIDNTTTDYGNAYIYDVTSVEGGASSHMTTSVNSNDNSFSSNSESDTDNYSNLDIPSDDESNADNNINESIISESVSSLVSAQEEQSYNETKATIDIPDDSIYSSNEQPLNDNMKLYFISGVVALIIVGLLGIIISVIAKHYDE